MGEQGIALYNLNERNMKPNTFNMKLARYRQNKQYAKYAKPVTLQVIDAVHFKKKLPVYIGKQNGYHNID